MTLSVSLWFTRGYFYGFCCIFNLLIVPAWGMRPIIMVKSNTHLMPRTTVLCDQLTVYDCLTRVIKMFAFLESEQHIFQLIEERYSYITFSLLVLLHRRMSATLLIHLGGCKCTQKFFQSEMCRYMKLHTFNLSRLADCSTHHECIILMLFFFHFLYWSVLEESVDLAFLCEDACARNCYRIL